MKLSVDPRFYFAIARDIARAVRHPQPVRRPGKATLAREQVPCPCDCGLTMGEKWVVEK